ncbi:MAG: hypothetical protein K2J70_02480 [Muribaculaceae bacterium]|nr:hypothetical protein [Muribaculaceae bacterium]
MIQKSFRNITELLNRLYQDKRLIAEMFYHRREIDFTRDDALSFTDVGRLSFLIDHGVIREEGDSLELEESYLQFFEEVLLANEDITGSAVADQVELLKENISFYLLERDNPVRQVKYLRKVKRNLRNIAQLSSRKVIDLKRNVNDTFKQEANYIIKRERLKKFLTNISEINRLVDNTQELLDDRSSTFEHFAPDDQLSTLIISVRIELNEVSRTIIEQQAVIREYLHRIDRQDRMVKKIRRVKMLKDQFVWTTATDLLRVLEERTDIFLEPLSPSPLKPSLAYLRLTDDGSAILEEVRKTIAKAMTADRKAAPPLSEGDFNSEPIEADYVDLDSLGTKFLLSDTDLFSFVMNYPYEKEQSVGKRLEYYSQLVQKLVDILYFTGEWRESGNFSYPLITALK